MFQREKQKKVYGPLFSQGDGTSFGGDFFCLGRRMRIRPGIIDAHRGVKGRFLKYLLIKM
jgi:hypothetical protein